MTRRMSHINLRDGKLIVTSWSSKTGRGIWFMNEHFSILDGDADDDATGAAIAAALENSRIGVSRPPDNPHVKALLATLGLPSFTAFMKGATEVAVVDDDEHPDLSVIPTKNGGSQEGFVELLDREQEVPRDASPASLARAVRQAFRHAI